MEVNAMEKAPGDFSSLLCESCTAVDRRQRNLTPQDSNLDPACAHQSDVWRMRCLVATKWQPVASAEPQKRTTENNNSRTISAAAKSVEVRVDGQIGAEFQQRFTSFRS